MVELEDRENASSPNDLNQSDDQLAGDSMQELVRLGEDVVSAQLRTSAEQLVKVRHLMTLAGGILVVAVAATSLVAGRTLGSSLGFLNLGIYGFLVPMTASFVTSFWAFFLFVLSVDGTGRQPYRILSGWDTKNLLEALEGGDSVFEIRRSTVYGIHGWIEQNRRIINRAFQSRRLGTKLVMLSGAFLALSLIYVGGSSVQ